MSCKEEIMKMTKGFLFFTLIALLAVFAGCSKKTSGPDGGPLAGEIRFSWWGNEARNNTTIEAIRFYEAKHPGLRVIPEYAAIDG
jgi:ABC-type glycerol-3-phosphate transport system substrate-binding protein